MIDLSLMNGIHVDPESRTASAQGGVTWNEFNRETQLHGLATAGGMVSSTGIAGLTLGGGLGWPMGKHALALTNLLSAASLLADGKIATARQNNNSDPSRVQTGDGGPSGGVSSFDNRQPSATGRRGGWGKRRDVRGRYGCRW